NLVGAVDHQADGEADASGARVGMDVPVAGELCEREQGQDDAAKLEGDELIVVHDLWPSERAIEVPEGGEITRTKSDQVRKWRGCVHCIDYSPGVRHAAARTSAVRRAASGTSEPIHGGRVERAPASRR